VTDIACGLYAHGAIMAALISRQQTGKGAQIDCNLFDSQVHPKPTFVFSGFLSLTSAAESR